MSEEKVKKSRDDLSGSVAVVGAGIAGMQCSLDLAEAGFLVHLVDRDISIGGNMAKLDKTFPTNDCSTCIISPKLIDVASNPNIRILSRSEVTSLEGEPGDFMINVHKAPRFIDLDVCTGCGECIKVCPVEVPADFNQGLEKRKAIYRHFPQAIPSAYAVDKAGSAPCKAACPVHISVQGYVALIGQGKFKEALALIRQDNPLPATCGRVCIRPCETACGRGEVDDPIAIRDLKKFAAEWELRQSEMDLPEVKERREEKVAVIGSGPAGLTCAYYLALEGYQVTIFEALPVAGGMMRVGIPDFRLPPEIIDYEIDFIKALGVEIRLNTPIGPDLTLDDLKEQGYQAVFMSVGAHKGLRLGVEGENAPGVLNGVEFLREAALGQAASPGERVAVIGGGNVAVDAARTARRLGSREVTILYRRSREEMPAYEEEIEEALEEGIKIEMLVAPTRFVPQGGHLSGVEVISMELGDVDDSGRRRPRPVAGSERVIPIDGAIGAIGQEPDLGFLEPETELNILRGSRLGADPVTLQTSIPWVFAGGDVVTGPASIIEAIAMGREAKTSIERYLKGEDLAAGREYEFSVAEVDKSGQAKQPRCQPPLADPQSRVCNFDEVIGIFDEATAQAEANRCLSCGVCSECYQCLEVCQAGAIIHDMAPQDVELKVGSVVMAPGFLPFDPAGKAEYGYGRYPNVLTSLEFERVLSASGPFTGHVQRPSDGAEPQRIAWIQCVGSRDASIGRDYCSYVCCMYATKQAVIAQEHLPGIETSIFYMDIRAQGKGFDRYYERAKDEHGVRYVRSMLSRIVEDPATRNLKVEYFDEADNLVSETFDMVVLSVGLVPHPAAKELAGALGVATDSFGFAQRTELNQLTTTREGVFACGVFQAPRDIPETVTQASGAAAEVGALLAPARGSEITAEEFPEERDVSNEEPRIGVFVCHCGINIGSVVDVPAVVEYAKGLPNVVHAEEFLFSCSTDSQDNVTEAIKEHNLNRVVIASCSPRTHEPLFRDTLRRAGLNQYLFEMANIRDQCSWVHAQDHEAATAKSKDLVRMSVARSTLLKPLRQFPAPVEQSALVIGGGPAGLTAAQNLAEQGFYTHLVEKTGELGGLARRLGRTLEGFDAQAYLTEIEDKVRHNGLIEVHLETEVVEVGGHIGQFTTKIRSGDKTETIRHGAVIVATGAAEYQPGEYLAGEDERVTTQLTFEEALEGDGDALAGIKDVVMIQCVGSREEEHSYCSRVCCSHSVSNALKIKELNPDVEVTILFRDVRTFALKELYYKQAREAGVRFIRFDKDQPPQVSPNGDGLKIMVLDKILGEWIEVRADKLVLAAAIRPREDAAELASSLKIPFDADGFFMEAHLKLRPVDFVNAGFFLAGTAHGPKFLEECIAQAKAAAARAATILAQDEMLVGGEVARVDGERCVACLTCVRSCPYGVPELNEEGVVYIDPAACHGCGICASQCPRKLIQIEHHTDLQTLFKTAALRA